MNIFEKIALSSFDYKVYWKNRNVKIRQRLLERERIFFNWIKPKIKVLDIAAGNSGLLSLLKKDKMCDVRAFDISQEVVDAQNNAGVSASARDVSSDNFNISDKYELIINLSS